MKTFYALVADGSSYAHANGGGFVGVIALWILKRKVACRHSCNCIAD